MRFIIYLILTILSCVFLKISSEKYAYKSKLCRGIILCNIIPLVSIIYSIYFCIYIYTGKIGIIGIDAIMILSIMIPVIILFSIIKLIGNFIDFEYGWIDLLYEASLSIIMMILAFSCIVTSFENGDTGEVYEQKHEIIEITLLDEEPSTYINGIVSTKNFKNTVEFYYENEETKDKSDIKVIPSANSYVEIFESNEETTPRIEVYSVSNIVRNVYEKEYTNKTYLKYKIYVPTGTVNYTFKN